MGKGNVSDTIERRREKKGEGRAWNSPSAHTEIVAFLFEGNGSSKGQTTHKTIDNCMRGGKGEKRKPRTPASPEGIFSHRMADQKKAHK